MLNKLYFTSESVTEGHPDKVCDQISDMLLDNAIYFNPSIHFSCETVISGQFIMLSGKMNDIFGFDAISLVRKKLKDIGFDHPDSGLNLSHLYLLDNIERPFISPRQKNLSTTTKIPQTDEGKKADDQGIFFGFACRETNSLMPLPISLAHQLVKKLDEVRKLKINLLLPYGKSQVTVEYRKKSPVRIDTIVLSLQVSPLKIYKNWKADLIENVIKPVLPPEFVDQNTRFFIQSCERKTHLGLTGRKLSVDTYGGYARNGGGAFSGKDISKLDRSANYMARYIAKNVVSAQLADYCEIQLSYAIGYQEPVSLNIYSNDTNRIPEYKICDLIRQHFQLNYEKVISQMQLNPAYYQKIAVYGHFGREDISLPWEMTDKAESLKSAAGI